MLRPNPLSYSARRTGICYDVRMRFHATVDEDDMHPEDPRRILEIYKAIVDAKLVDDPMYTGVVPKDDWMMGISAREVTMDEALLVHSREHWDFLEATQGRSACPPTRRRGSQLRVHRARPRDAAGTVAGGRFGVL